MIEIKNYIGGALKNPSTQSWLNNSNPATGEALTKTPDSNSSDVAQAIEAASAAFKSWSELTARDRAEYLRKIAAEILKRREALARAESDDSGKPLSLSMQLDIPRSAYNFEFFADAATQFSSESHASDAHTLNYTLRAPLGVVGCISPWNLPLYLLTWKIAPALAAGNCVVAKPSEVTPLTAYLLSQICIDVGLPAGVLNIVHGTGPRVGAALSSDPKIKAVSFTGSTKTGAEIARTAAPLFKKLSLEMGGKNPNIIFADCDFEETLSQSLKAAFSNQGQICLCGSRIYIEKTIYNRFRDAFVEKARALKVGDPLEASTEQGALVSQAHFEKVMSCIERAQKEGGKVLCGAKKFRARGRCEKGFFIEPTVIEGLSADSLTNQEEIFGPVVTLTPFDGEAESIALANSTHYGLAASVFTQNLARAHRMASAIQSGIVWVNCWMNRDLRTPFGGVKTSGVGREGGFEALRFFTEAKNVCIKY